MANGRRLVKHSCWPGCYGSPVFRCLSTSNLDLVSPMHNIPDPLHPQHTTFSFICMYVCMHVFYVFLSLNKGEKKEIRFV